MKKIILTIFLACLFCNAWSANSPQIDNQTVGGNPVKAENVNANFSTNTIINSNSGFTESQTNQPKTVRDFFNLLPQKYFLLEGCEPAKDKNCQKARAAYLKTFLEVEDTANGYLKGGCDGA